MLHLDKFKERTKALCAKNGIQLKFIHQNLGRGTTYLNDIWRGRTTPSDQEFQAIANILHTTPEYLRGETDDPSVPEADWVTEIKKDPRKEGLMKRLAKMDVETLLKMLKIEEIIDMLEGEE